MSLPIPAPSKSSPIEVVRESTPGADVVFGYAVSVNLSGGAHLLKVYLRYEREPKRVRELARFVGKPDNETLEEYIRLMTFVTAFIKADFLTRRTEARRRPPMKSGRQRRSRIISYRIDVRHRKDD